jgi:hypothetical protein
MKGLTVSIAVAALIAATPLFAIANDEEQPQEQPEAAERAEHSAESQHEHGREHENEVAVFFGGTDERGHDTEFTLGLDYKRRIAERWAVGGIFDYAGGELRNTVLAPSVSFWPGLGNLQLLAAPGVEFHQGRDDGGHEKSAEGEADKDATYFLFRLGVAYDIHLGERFGLAPQVNLDFVNNEEVWVWGIAVTYGF